MKSKNHGLSHTPEFGVWSRMKRRCYDKNYRSYKWYGARGIAVHPLWMISFQDFLNHIGKRPSNRHEIDRIDNNGNYEPGNVQWSLHKTQSRNKRSNRIVEFNGKRACVTEWAEQYGVKPLTLLWRIDHGWPIKCALTLEAKIGANQTISRGRKESSFRNDNISEIP